jgi:hypothetical protein
MVFEDPEDSVRVDRSQILEQRLSNCKAPLALWEGAS